MNREIHDAMGEGGFLCRLLIYQHLASEVFSCHSVPSVRLFLLPAINSSRLFKFDVLIESLMLLSEARMEPLRLTVKPTVDLLHSILASGSEHLGKSVGKTCLTVFVLICSGVIGLCSSFTRKSDCPLSQCPAVSLTEWLELRH